MVDANHEGSLAKGWREVGGRGWRKLAEGWRKVGGGLAEGRRGQGEAEGWRKVGPKVRPRRPKPRESEIRDLDPKFGTSTTRSRTSTLKEDKSAWDIGLECRRLEPRRRSVGFRNCLVRGDQALLQVPPPFNPLPCAGGGPGVVAGPPHQAYDMIPLPFQDPRLWHVHGVLALHKPLQQQQQHQQQWGCNQ